MVWNDRENERRGGNECEVEDIINLWSHLLYIYIFLFGFGVRFSYAYPILPPVQMTLRDESKFGSEFRS
jgi:hypothetical protein